MPVEPLNQKLQDRSLRIAIIGLGYVGLPLAVEFAKQFPTVGFDIKAQRIDQLNRRQDITNEVEPADWQAVQELTFTCDPDDLKNADVYIVTVPTPIDRNKLPDLKPLISASQMLGKVIGPGCVVIYESTVYPGATEEDCMPAIESESGLRFNQDFFAGYSPERINPGDRQHRLPDIVKVTAGSNPEIAEFVDQLYASIIPAGTHIASSIRVAEAAKVIENTQRDLNIALINELAIIFERMGLDTHEVLAAAGTKWNFLRFFPGLVGGHCIGVDPYYLTHKAQQLGYSPEVILAGRRINDGMGAYIVSQVVKLMIQRRVHVHGSRVLVLGLTFKENCPDIRNTRVIDIIAELEDYGVEVDVYDPWVDPQEAEAEYGLALKSLSELGQYEGIVLAVAHQRFQEEFADGFEKYKKPGGVVYDVKSTWDRQYVDKRL